MRDLRNIWHFVRVTKAGSFSAAADALSLSTAALSKSIAKLEHNMGVQLFVRTSSRLHLTAEGRVLFDKVDGHLAGIDEAMEQVRGPSTLPTGTVRLSTVTGYGKHCVLPLLSKFITLYPAIELVVSLHDGRRDLSRQSFEIRINWGEEKEQNKVAQVLCDMPLVVVASPDYLARRGTPRSPSDLNAHDCINVALPRGGRAHWTFISALGGPRTRTVVMPKGKIIVMDELDAVADAAIAGLGITVSSSEAVLAALREGTLVRILEEYRVIGHNKASSQIIIQYAVRRQLAYQSRLLVDFLIGHLKGRNPLDVIAAIEEERHRSQIVTARADRSKGELNFE